MLQRVNKVLIGKDINRTASLVIGGASENIAEGEVVVLDKNKNILAAGSTVADSDVIYIAVAEGDTFSYTNEAGTLVSNVNRLVLSDPIEGKSIKNYIGRAYTAATEQVATLSGALTPVVGTEYGIRIVYKDLYQRPGQFTHTYRVVATTATLADLYTALAAAINTHTGSRVTAVATAGPDVLTLTAKAVNDNEQLDSINEYSQVNFELFLVTDNFGAVVVAYTANPHPGFGTWKLVRDAEKHALSYRGIMNRTHFPVIMPAFKTVKSETYNTIVIEYDRTYQSPDNQYEKKTPLTTEIYIPNTATSNQTTDVLAVLNPWMESAGQVSISF
jgi:hypothetical protein